MIEDYFTDKVVIIRRTVDEWNQVSSTEKTVDARVDKSDNLVKGPEGEDVQSSWMVYISKNEDVEIGDRIKIRELRGESVATVEFPILSIFIGGGFEPSHKEITI